MKEEPKETKLICELCGEEIGTVLTDRLAFPLRGDMFGSCDPEHGRPAPFDESLTWAEMRCPYGRTHRPFIDENYIFTDDREGWYCTSEGGYEYTPNRRLPGGFWDEHHAKRKVQRQLSKTAVKRKLIKTGRKTIAKRGKRTGKNTDSNQV